MSRGRPRQRFCLNGHDTAVVGRTAVGTCGECARLHSKNYKAGLRGGLPATRIRQLAKTRQRASDAWASYRWCEYKSAQRAADRLWDADCISINSADRWCIALGTHLVMVFPELYLLNQSFPEESVA